MKKLLLLVFFMTSFSIFSESGIKNLELECTGQVKLSPSFKNSIFSYEGKVQSDITQINLKLTLFDKNDKIFVNGQIKNINEVINIPLLVGKNQINLKIENSLKSIEYSINIEREDITPVVNKFIKLIYTDKETGETMPYRLYIPEGYDGTKSYPLVLFLHGGGERGSDNEAQLIANQGATIWAKPEEQAKRPCFVLAPQAHNQWNGGFGLTRNSNNVIDLTNVFEPTKDLKMAYNVLQEVLKNYKIDQKRVYSTGVSQGGFGTWNLNIMYPETFAAMVPICGGANPVFSDKLLNKPIWAFHAEADPIIPVSYTQNIIKSLLTKGAKPIYTEYDKTTYIKPVEHFSWILAYKNEDMRIWLFNQKKN